MDKKILSLEKELLDLVSQYKKLGDTELEKKEDISKRGKVVKETLILWREMKDISDLVEIGTVYGHKSAAEVFNAQSFFYKHKYPDLVKKIAIQAKAYLEGKGLIKCGRLGWYRKEDTAKAGIFFNGKEWVIEHLDMYKQFHTK